MSKYSAHIIQNDELLQQQNFQATRIYNMSLGRLVFASNVRQSLRTLHTEVLIHGNIEANFAVYCLWQRYKKEKKLWVKTSFTLFCNAPKTITKPFHATGIFLYPLKTLENLWGYIKRPETWIRGYDKRPKR